MLTILKTQSAPADMQLCVLGFWFHIDWQTDQRGVDQHGNIWKNKANPVCENQKMINHCLDAYNSFTKQHVCK